MLKSLSLTGQVNWIDLAIMKRFCLQIFHASSIVSLTLIFFHHFEANVVKMNQMMVCLGYEASGHSYKSCLDS